MSIEWLLTKTQKTQIQGKTAESACHAVEPPEGTYSTQPARSNKRMNGHQEQDHRVREHPTDYSVDNQHSKPYLRCGCGYDNQVPLPLSGKEKSGIVRLRCAGCGGELLFNSLTGIIRTRKGILGFLFGRFQ